MMFNNIANRIGQIVSRVQFINQKIKDVMCCHRSQTWYHITIFNCTEKTRINLLELIDSLSRYRSRCDTSITTIKQINRLIEHFPDRSVLEPQTDKSRSYFEQYSINLLLTWYVDGDFALWIEFIPKNKLIAKSVYCITDIDANFYPIHKAITL